MPRDEDGDDNIQVGEYYMISDEKMAVKVTEISDYVYVTVVAANKALKDLIGQSAYYPIDMFEQSVNFSFPREDVEYYQKKFDSE